MVSKSKGEAKGKRKGKEKEKEKKKEKAKGKGKGKKMKKEASVNPVNDCYPTPSSIGRGLEDRPNFLGTLCIEYPFLKILEYYSGLLVRFPFTLSISGLFTSHSRTQTPNNPDYDLLEVDNLEWATWEYASSFLPSIYHESDVALDELVYWLQSDVWLTRTGGVTSNITILEKFLLVAGLFYRDMKTVQYEAEDSDGNPSPTIPSFITNSVFKWGTLSPAFDSLLERMASRLKERNSAQGAQLDASGAGPSGHLPALPKRLLPLSEDRDGSEKEVLSPKQKKRGRAKDTDNTIKPAPKVCFILVGYDFLC